ncbi:MAG: heparinase II/III family protein [Candidatus Glassbacteria bacterium]
MRLHRFAVALAILLCQQATAAALELGPHPRLYLNRQPNGKVPGVDQLRGRIGQRGYAEIWRRVKTSNHASDRALVYLLTADTTGLAALREQLGQVIGRYDGLVDHSLAFDWAYAVFSGPEKKLFAGKLIESVQEVEKRYQLATVYHNMCWGRNMGQGLAMLAAWGDDPRAEGLEGLVRQELGELQEILGDGVPAGEMTGRAGWGGGWPESYDYDRHGSHYALLLLLAWRSAGLGDYFTGSSYWRDKVLYLLYGTGPDGSFILGYEDNDWPFPMPHDRRMMSFLEGEYKSGLASWWIDTFADTLVVAPHFWEFLFSDPSVPSTPPEGLPGSYLVRGLGLALMRSSWDRDATFVHFHCGPYYTYHQHEAQGSFSAFRNRWLVVEPGVYDGNVDPHYVNWRIRTISHNCITVFDPAERFHGPGDVPEPANDGGQVIQHWTHKPDNLAEFRAQQDLRIAGKITAFASDDSHDYVAGEAGMGYNPDKVRRWCRQMVFVKPDWLVVCDLVESTDPTFAKTLFLHTPELLELAGNLAVTGSGAEPPLAAWSLLPRGAGLKVEGGPGKTFTYGGHDWTGPEGYNTQITTAWRLEVAALAGRETVYLTVLDLAGAGRGSLPKVELLESGPQEVRVALAGDCTVTLDPTASKPYRLTGKSVRYAIEGSVLKGGLPTEGAQVAVSGNGIRQMQVTPYHGRYRFTGLSAGSYQVSLPDGRTQDVKITDSSRWEVNFEL